MGKPSLHTRELFPSSGGCWLARRGFHSVRLLTLCEEERGRGDNDRLRGGAHVEEAGVSKGRGGAPAKGKTHTLPPPSFPPSLSARPLLPLFA
jgi:hypothetical protein